MPPFAPMSPFASPAAPINSTPFARSIFVATFAGAAMLVTPLARADDAANAPSSSEQAAPQNEAVAKAEAKAETVEQRISNLHSLLKITPDEESKWDVVAQTMRDNAAAMQQLAAEKKSETRQTMNAVEDLKTYQLFAQAHADGLKKLVSSFETLYDAMPADQKAVADQVFQNFGHKGAPAHS